LELNIAGQWLSRSRTWSKVNIAKIKAGHLLENPVQAPMFQNLTTLNFSDILKKPGLL